jgi:hypothetical protein
MKHKKSSTSAKAKIKKNKKFKTAKHFCMAMVSRTLWEKMGSGCHNGKIVGFDCR